MRLPARHPHTPRSISNRPFYEGINLDPDDLLEANRGLIERMERDGVTLVYDGALDSLLLEFGGPKVALSEHLLDNMMARIDPDTLEIVGLEITDFLADFLPNNRLFQEFFQDLDMAEGKDLRVTLMEARFKPIRDMIGAALHQMAHSIAGSGVA